MPKKNESGERRYGVWAGNPMGHAEDTNRCIAEVPAYPSWTRAQCSRKRGHGPNGEFCKQHAKRHGD